MSIGPAIVLDIVFLAIIASALYWIVRKAVAHGIQDARRAATAKTGSEVPARAG